jgi:hypothetical protein
VPTLITYRDTIRKISPPWLQNGLAEKILYALAVQIDAFGDALTAGVKQRFPGLYSDESLPLIGRERRIRRGRTETTSNYAGRLNRWLTDHPRRGGPYAMLAQLFAHFAPNTFPIDLIYYSGRRYQMDVNGNVVRNDLAWFPDDDAAHWARYWLFFYTDAFPSPSAEEIADLKLIPREWTAAHALGYIVVFPAGAELINFPPGHLINEPGTINTTVEALFVPVDE